MHPSKRGRERGRGRVENVMKVHAGGGETCHGERRNP